MHLKVLLLIHARLWKRLWHELVRILEATLAEPSAHLTDRSPIYALLLLGYFKATEAHSVLVDLVSLPNDWPHQLFGDLITEELTMLLYNTSDNQFARMYDLVRNDQIDPFVRSAAADVLVYGVADGVLDREEGLAFFGSLLATEQSAETESLFLTLLVGRINDLYPAEILPILRQILESDVIDTMYIDLAHVEKTLANNTLESALASVRTEMAQRSLDDIHTLLAEWLDFGGRTRACSTGCCGAQNCYGSEEYQRSETEEQTQDGQNLTQEKSPQMNKTKPEDPRPSLDTNRLGLLVSSFRFPSL